jgi:hypothetical protein
MDSDIAQSDYMQQTSNHVRNMKYTRRFHIIARFVPRFSVTNFATLKFGSFKLSSIAPSNRGTRFNGS